MGRETGLELVSAYEKHTYPKVGQLFTPEDEKLIKKGKRFQCTIWVRKAITYS